MMGQKGVPVVPMERSSSFIAVVTYLLFLREQIAGVIMRLKVAFTFKEPE
ncbi:hypothetical protein [Ferruginibacter profundus]